MNNPTPLSLQERYSPESICFGCGPKNPKGLHVRSFVRRDPGTDKDHLIASFKPESHHEAFPGMVNGGIIGALLDCHSNWTAAWHLMQAAHADSPPCCVTADFAVKLKRPTPSGSTLELDAWVVEASADRAVIESKITVDGQITATCRGTFVAVKPGHPAYHRW